MTDYVRCNVAIELPSKSWVFCIKECGHAGEHQGTLSGLPEGGTKITWLNTASPTSCPAQVKVILPEASWRYAVAALRPMNQAVSEAIKAQLPAEMEEVTLVIVEQYFEMARQVPRGERTCTVYSSMHDKTLTFQRSGRTNRFYLTGVV